MSKFNELVYEHLGRASMCWSESPKGTFDSTTASELGRDIINKHEQIIKGAKHTELMSDFPKIKCPFIRKTFHVEQSSWKKFGRQAQLRRPEVYLAQDEVLSGYEWVFENKDCIAIEKLDGTNVKIKTENGRLTQVQNRLNIIDPLQVVKGNTAIIEGIFTSIRKGYVNGDGEQSGELIGPKLQGNPYGLLNHVFYPFDRLETSMTYKSFHEHERTFDNWSNWFKNYLRSRFYMKLHKCPFEESVFAEGIVIYSPSRRDEGLPYMAKLKRSMFPWYYERLGIIIGDMRDKQFGDV